MEGESIRRPLPIVGMSACSDAETESMAFSVGMNGFIDKPFKFKNLVAFFELTRDKKDTYVKRGYQ